MPEDYFNQIPRVSCPDRQVFEKEYILKRHPVIITDLFHENPLQDVTSMDEVVNRFGDVPIIVSEGFRPHLFTSKMSPDHTPSAHENFTIKKYIEFIGNTKDTFALCNENELPEHISSIFPVPEYCQFGSVIDDVTSRLFIGNAGNYAHLHFDGDFRQVLFYQVVGSKRIILFPPESAAMLTPEHHWSLMCLEHFTEIEKAAFTAYGNGCQCVLNPGETLFIPSTMWHYVEYLTTGMSIAFRFGRNSYTKFLSENLHKDSLIQRIASRMLDECIVQERYSDVYSLLIQAYELPSYSVRQKVEQMTLAYQQAWFLMSNEAERLLQLPKTDTLLNATSLINTSFYQSIIQPTPSYSGWNFLPTINK